MLFNKHSHLEGRHAFLSASKSSWTNYDDDKLERVWTTAMAAAYGTRLHAFAAEAIKLGQRMPETQQTLNMYVNDAIDYQMRAEQPLYYSDNAFGTPDAIGFRGNTLRIHDLKTGESHASERQLEVYAAFFCLEYAYRPFELNIEMRIYQSNDIRVYEADPLVIFNIMEKIKHFDKIINERKREREGLL